MRASQGRERRDYSPRRCPGPWRATLLLVCQRHPTPEQWVSRPEYAMSMLGCSKRVKHPVSLARLSGVKQTSDVRYWG